jgi:hypothetical protein
VLNSGGVTNFSTRVTLSFRSQNVTAGACAYAIHYPPFGRYTAYNQIQFTGTPPFYLTYTDNSPAIVPREPAPHTYTYTIPSGKTLQSFTDLSGAPGTFNCVPPDPPSITQKSAACNLTVLTVPQGSGGNGIRWWDNTYSTDKNFTATTNASAVTTSSCGINSRSATKQASVSLGAGINSAPNGCGCISGASNCWSTCQYTCNRFRTVYGSYNANICAPGRFVQCSECTAWRAATQASGVACIGPTSPDHDSDGNSFTSCTRCWQSGCDTGIGRAAFACVFP